MGKETITISVSLTGSLNNRLEKYRDEGHVNNKSEAVRRALDMLLPELDEEEDALMHRVIIQKIPVAKEETVSLE